MRLQKTTTVLPTHDQLVKKAHTNFQKVYKRKLLTLGSTTPHKDTISQAARKQSVAIVGVALGDEGKGRFVDNTIATLLQKKSIKTVYVIRFQGGNNAGHTVEKGDIKLALHVVPSAVLYLQAIGVMDRGMVIHIEDLMTEIQYVEEKVGALQKRLFLSNDAILCTDLERAEEQLNSMKEGLSKGGTGRGIGPSYAHHYDKTGLRIYDLLNADWREKLQKRYERYEKEFAAFGLNLQDIAVPDFTSTKKTNITTDRTVGDMATFIERLEKARTWIVKRDMVINTFPLHQAIFADPTVAVVFEGAQAAGLDTWIGTRPDVTASNPSVYGIREGTGFWRAEDIAEKIGVLKVPYTSSVGARRMPTHIDLPKDLAGLPSKASDEQEWASFIRREAHEYGTTTGRPRDINHLDLALLTYNARMAGVTALAVTHLDIARATDVIKVCTHYTDRKGTYVPYQPGLHFLNGVMPQYSELPGWDGRLCQKAKTAVALPFPAKQFLSFLQAQIGLPIIVATTGPKREHLIRF